MNLSIGLRGKKMQKRIIDLSHPMIPSKMNRKLEVKKLLVGDTRPLTSTNPEEKKVHIFEHPPDQRNTVPIPDGQYFLMSEIELNTHAGTHIEIPYHCLKGKQDFIEFPLERLCGPLVVLHMRGLSPYYEVSLEEMKKVCNVAGGIQKGDIVFCDFGYDAFFFESPEKYVTNPYPSLEAVRWLVDRGIKMFGVDAGMIERPKNPIHENHLLFLEKDISIIENLASLDQVKRNRAEVYAFPIAVKFAESMPVRVVAIEEMD
jgi:arylformamidase